MADLTIENLDEATLAMLRIRAAKNDRSMEEEARELLTEALAGAAIASDDDLVRVSGDESSPSVALILSCRSRCHRASHQISYS